MVAKSPPRVSVLYFSGAGGTRLVAETVGELLAPATELRVRSIAHPSASGLAGDSDLLVLCYPTYFLRPSPSMREFIDSLGPFDPPRKAFLVTTYELYTENSLRACALRLRERGVLVLGAAALRAPGTDATLVFPAPLVPWLYRFERDFPSKLEATARAIRSVLDRSDAGGMIPAPKWYTPFAQALQVLLLDGFERWRWRIRALPGRCDLCGACVALCERGAWRRVEGGMAHEPEACELCTRCLHRCPSRAIVLLEVLRDNPRLDRKHYAGLEEAVRKRLGLGSRAREAAAPP